MHWQVMLFGDEIEDVDKHNRIWARKYIEAGKFNHEQIAEIFDMTVNEVDVMAEAFYDRHIEVTMSE